jgi:hypothetical protein
VTQGKHGLAHGVLALAHVAHLSARTQHLWHLLPGAQTSKGLGTKRLQREHGQGVQRAGELALLALLSLFCCLCRHRRHLARRPLRLSGPPPLQQQRLLQVEHSDGGGELGSCQCTRDRAAHLVHATADGCRQRASEVAAARDLVASEAHHANQQARDRLCVRAEVAHAGDVRQQGLWQVLSQRWH